MTLNETNIRQSGICPGCGNLKPAGCLVCWHCFKRRQDVTPLKYFDGSVNKWLRMVRTKTRRSAGTRHCQGNGVA